VKDHENFAKEVAEKGARESFEDFEDSMGMKLKEEDVSLLKEYAGQLKGMYTLKKDMEKYLGKVVPRRYPT
jgi:RNA processing factor Prp31